MPMRIRPLRTRAPEDEPDPLRPILYEIDHDENHPSPAFHGLLWAFLPALALWTLIVWALLRWLR